MANNGSIKPTDFPSISNLTGFEEVYTQTGGNNGKFTVNQILGLVSGSTENLAQTLIAGNETSGTSIILSNGDVAKAKNGGGELNLRAGTDNAVALTADNGAYNKGWAYFDDSYSQIGYGFTGITSSFTAQNDIATITLLNTSDGEIAMSNFDLYIYGNTKPSVQQPFKITSVSGNYKTNYCGNYYGLLLNTGKDTSPSRINQNVSRTIISGGEGIRAKTDNTNYMNQASFQESGNLFDNIIVASTGVTQDNTATLPNTSGTISVKRTIGVSSNHNAKDGEIIFGTVGVSGITITLEDAALRDEMQITVKQIDNGGGNLGITSAGGNIDGSALPITVPAQNNGYQFTSFNGNWWITATF